MPATAYPLPPGLDRDPDLTVAIDGALAGVGLTPVGSYAIAAIDGPALVEIAADRPLDGAVLRPAARGLAVSCQGGRLRLAVDRPGPLTLELPGRPPLHLFLHPPAEEPRGKVRRLAAGQVHELGEVRLGEGETLHIEGGAALRGWIRACGAGTRITGHGIVDGSRFPHHWRRSILLDRCTDAVVEGITVVGSPSWTVTLAGCDRVAVRRVNLIGWVVCSDGIDVVGSRDVVIEDCFLRDNDDCVAVKALDIEGIGAAAMRDVARVLVQRCVCWNDHSGNVFEIGYETRCDRIAGVVFRDCDVIGAHGEGGVFTIHAGDRAEIADVLYEDIRIEHMYDKFVDFRVLFSRYSRDAGRGRIRDVVLRRIRACPDPFNTVSLIGGFDAGHDVSGVRFEDVRIGDRTLASVDELHLFTRHARDISVTAKTPGSIPGMSA